MASPRSSRSFFNSWPVTATPQISLCALGHTPGSGCRLYAAQSILDEEDAMRRLIESLTPDSRRLYWRWVAGVFGLYVALLVSAAGVFISHESSRNLRHETATTVAIKGNRAATHQAYIQFVME